MTDAGKKKSIFLAVCGRTMFLRINSLLTLTHLESINLDELAGEIEEFYNPKSSIMLQRFQFNTRERAQGKSISSLHC